MNSLPELETLLRSLEPGELPADLQLRLQEPAVESSRKRPWVWMGAVLAAAAAVAWMWRPVALDLPSNAEAGPVTVHQVDSELLQSTPMGFIEKDGRIYRVEEQIWRDDESAYSSGKPVLVSHSVGRKETVCLPVRFD